MRKSYKGQNNSQFFTTPKELRDCVLAAQQKSNAAMERLRQAFLPLIMQEAHRPHIYGILGEDAENIAWEIFYTLIVEYEDCNQWETLGKYIKDELYRQLQHTAFPRLQKNHEAYKPILVSLQSQQEDGQELVSPINQVDEFLQSLSLKQLIEKLPVIYRDVLQLRYFSELNYDECSERLHISNETCRQRCTRAIQMLRKNILAEKIALA